MTDRTLDRAPDASSRRNPEALRGIRAPADKNQVSDPVEIQDQERIRRERQLRRAVLGGDPDAWESLYQDHFDALEHHLARRTRGDRELVEDVVQESWLVAVRRMADWDPGRGPFGAWLRGIADRQLANAWRRRDRRPGTTSSPAAWQASAAPGPGFGEELGLAMADLPPAWQAVLAAHYEHELPVAGIAARTGRTPKAIESLLARARRGLRRALTRRGIGDREEP